VTIARRDAEIPLFISVEPGTILVMVRGLTISGVIFLATAPAPAQTVQQPVVQTFGGSTTVSVPDRGSVSLGGVSSAASGRKVYGPGYRGSSYGVERSAGSLSVGVTIIDLHAMDEALLSQGDSPITDNAWISRLQSRAAGTRHGGPPSPAVTVDAAAQSRRFEQLAIAAEAKGKPSLARLHWQMAAKYGSDQARQRLEQTAVSHR